MKTLLYILFFGLGLVLVLGGLVRFFRGVGEYLAACRHRESNPNEWIIENNQPPKPAHWKIEQDIGVALVVRGLFVFALGTLIILILIFFP